MNTNTSASAGWEATLTAADEMTAELQGDGYEVTTVRAAQVIPETPADGDTKRFGLVFVVGKSDGEELQDRISASEFSEYEAYNQRQDGTLFVVTQLFDESRQHAVLLVGAVDLTHAEGLLSTVSEHNKIYSHVQLLDGTVVGSFEHTNPEAIVPVVE